MLVDDMIIKMKDARVGRGALLGNNGIYLDRHSVPTTVDKPDLHLVKEFGKRR
jgi:hypothetical protein